MRPGVLILREFGNGSVRFDDLVLNTLPIADNTIRIVSGGTNILLTSD